MAVDLPFPEEEVPQLLPCVVANTPASPSDVCRVTIPDMATARTFRVNWEPHGGTYPAAGTSGCVMRDSAGQWWLLMWIGGWS